LPGSIAITDACAADGALIVTHSDGQAGSCPYKITRAYTVTDLCGNSITFQQTINIEDTQPPVATGSLTPLAVEGCGIGSLPPAVTSVAELEALPGGLSITDACTPGISLSVASSSIANGNCPRVVTRTYTIVDGCSNYVNVIHTINIDDTQAPDVTGSLSPLTIEGCGAADAPAPATKVAELEAMPGGLTVSDICTDKNLIGVTHSDVVAGSCPTVITRTYTVVDGCSNFTSFNQTISCFSAYLYLLRIPSIR